MRPSATSQTRSRVNALIVKRNRSQPSRSSRQTAGSLPYMCANSVPDARAAQVPFDFVRAGPRRRDVPLRRQAGVEQRDAELRIVVQQWPRLQPVEQGLGIGGFDDGAQLLVVRRQCGATARHGEQVQVVVAQHDDGRVAERLRPGATSRASAGRD